MATALQTDFHNAVTNDEPVPADMVRALIRSGMPAVELAALCGVSERTVYNWLSAKGFNPSRRHARLIRAAYDQFVRGRVATSEVLE